MVLERSACMFFPFPFPVCLLEVDLQTGCTDIPLTENGEKIVKEMGPRVMGPGCMSFSSTPRPALSNYYRRAEPATGLIDASHIRHIFISPRQRAQKTADLVSHQSSPVA